MTFVGRKFLHAADLHIGSPLARLDGCTALEADDVQELTAQMQAAFDEMITLAIAEDVLFVVLSGDVYDNADSQDAQQGRFQRGLERLNEAGIRVFIALGNHDPMRANFRPRKAYPENVTIFRTDNPEEFEVARDGDRRLMVAGVSFGTKHEHNNLAARFEAFEDRPEVVRVGVLHTNVTDGPSAGDHDPYAPCTVSDLRNAPVHYWALGHIHLRSVNQMGPGRWWAYPGNLQGRNFKPAECHPKGVLLVPIDSDGFGEPEFRACDMVRFSTLEVNVEQCDDVVAVQQAVVDSVTEAVEAADGRRVVVRVQLSGRTDLHPQISQSVASGQFLDEIADSWQVELGETIIAGVVVQTSRPIDMVKAREGDTLLAASLRRLDAMSDDEVIAIAVELISARFVKNFKPVSATEFRSLVELSLVDSMSSDAEMDRV